MFLSAVFFMLTLAAYARYARAPPTSISARSVACRFVADVLKPMLVTLPFALLLLLDYWPLGRDWKSKSKQSECRLRRLITEKIPLVRAVLRFRASRLC